MGAQSGVCNRRVQVYGHRCKAGNRGDMGRHMALLAALDTLIAEGGYHNLAYAEPFAGFPETVLRPGQGRETGIG